MPMLLPPYPWRTNTLNQIMKALSKWGEMQLLINKHHRRRILIFSYKVGLPNHFDYYRLSVIGLLSVIIIGREAFHSFFHLQISHREASAQHCFNCRNVASNNIAVCPGVHSPKYRPHSMLLHLRDMVLYSIVSVQSCIS